METRVTKGPWMVKHSESKPAWNVVGTQLGLKYKIARCPYDVSDVLSDIINIQSKNEAEANAKLIAAAPDLLESLQSLLNIINERGIEGLFTPAHVRAKQAIKNATE